MTKLSVEVDQQLINDVQERLGEFGRRAPNAVSNALNRGASKIKTSMSKEVRQDYHVKARDVKDTINIRRASRGDLRASVESYGSPIGLEKFKVSPKTVNPRRKSPIKASVKKDTGLRQILGAFVADINGPKVFYRKTSKRLPIQRMFGPSVPQMLDNEDVRNRIEQQGMETFWERLDHEINRIIEQGRAKQQ